MIDPTVYIVDDDEAVRQAVGLLVKSCGRKVETYGCAEAFLEGYDAAKPGCLILDVRMPGISGLSLQSMLSEEIISLPIIIITGHGDINMAVKATKAGAIDFIEKPFRDQDLLDSIERGIAKDLQNRKNFSGQAEYAKRFSTLSEREKGVLLLLVEGKLNKVVASELGISHKTVEFHRKNVMTKMDAESFAQLVTWAVQNNISE
jgi:FixJ family two-component response regulator